MLREGTTGSKLENLGDGRQAITAGHGRTRTHGLADGMGIRWIVGRDFVAARDAGGPDGWRSLSSGDLSSVIERPEALRDAAFHAHLREIPQHVAVWPRMEGDDPLRASRAGIAGPYPRATAWQRTEPGRASLNARARARFEVRRGKRPPMGDGRGGE